MTDPVDCALAMLAAGIVPDASAIARECGGSHHGAEKAIEEAYRRLSKAAPIPQARRMPPPVGRVGFERADAQARNLPRTKGQRR